MFVEE